VTERKSEKCAGWGRRESDSAREEKVESIKECDGVIPGMESIKG